MNTYSMYKVGRSMLVVLIAVLLTSAGCDKEENEDFSPAFTYTFQDENNVLFENTSTGEYYSLVWDFGNGQGDTTTDRKQTYLIYYPVAGDYNVSLRLTNYVGDNKTTTQTISVTNTDLLLSFTAEPDPADPNMVRLRNTTQGEYESFKWIYRNKEVENEMEHEAYFPFSGNYDVELQVVKNGEITSLTQTVTIAADDPNYLDKLVLTWAEEFDGPEVNRDNWTFETGANGWGNQELQNYTDGDNSEIVDGVLVITAEKVNDNTEPGSYTSSRMITENKKEFQYGKMEIRARLPSGTGIWPAIWMLGADFRSAGWPACGEMDIMEYVGYDPNVVHSTVHTPSGFGNNGNGSSKALETAEEEFHIYGMIWTEKRLVFYVDDPDNVVHTYAPPVKNAENWPFDQPAFFILNVAVGGTWGGAQGVDNSIFPQSMEVDYVRVYQEE